MNGHWYVIASQLRVKVFTQDLESKKLKLLKTLENPLGRERSRNLHGKKPGISITSFSGVHNVESGGLSPHEQAAVQFSREVAEYLGRTSENKDFVSLTVAAEPHFLGKLKASMEAKIKEKVTEWIEKDYQKLPDQDLPEVLNLKAL